MQSHPTLICLIALLGSAPLIVMLFAILPARRAMVIGAIIASVLLPPLSLDLPGLPAFDKFMAASLGILFGALIFDTGRILSFRPHWFDLPILLFCLSPFATSISNNLGPYDGLSAAFSQVVASLLPYIIGRLYLTDAESFRELAKGMILSAVCMIPFCLLEMRIGPQLQQRIYGTGGWEGMTEGNFRPRLFFQTGLALGLWMNTTTLLTWWLWRSGRFRTLWGLPSGSVILPALLITSILCRARGATLLGLAGACTLWSCTRYKSKWVIWGLLAIAPTYYWVRITNLWTGENLVNLVEKYVSEERASSISVRFLEERVIIARAMKRPTFGWGRYNRYRVIDDEFGDTITWSFTDGDTTYLKAVDSLWSIVLGQQGFAGLASMTIAMILPVWLFLARFPVRQWDHPDLAPVAVMAVIVSLFLLDGLSNSMLNPMYLIMAGGLFNINPARVGPRASVAGEDQAARYQSLGRAAKDCGQADEAAAAWQHALDLWTELIAAHPQHPAFRRQWCDCANDLAWLLANATDPTVRDPAGAVALAGKAVELATECSTYWNTLGVAHYRAGEFQTAIADLNQAATLSDGGTAFDHLFLAMAHARLGNPEDARRWFDLAMIGMDHLLLGHAELCRLRDEARSIVPEAVTVASH